MDINTCTRSGKQEWRPGQCFPATQSAQITISSLSNVKKTPRICVAVGFQCANLVSFCSFYKTKHILETEERLSRISDTFLLSSGGHSTVDFETDEKKMKNSGSDSLFFF